MDAPAEAATARKVPKEKRMTYREEMKEIKAMPRLSRAILLMKFGGVIFFAIGLEGLVSGRPVLAVTFLVLGLVISLLPIKVKLHLCVRCGRKLDFGQAICPSCGVPNM